MSLEREHRQKIQEYYTIAQPYYRFLWHGHSLGLHYGFWTGEVKNRMEAIVKENESLANVVDIKGKDLVLDVGSGIGGSDIWLAQEKGVNVVGLNIVDRQLIRGRDLVKEKGLGQKVNFVKGDYQELPFKAESFDVFLSLESIEHATNLDKFYSEAFRVLKPEGRIVIAGTFLGEKELTNKEKEQMKIGQEVAGCFNDFRKAEENVDLMKKAGFKQVYNVDMTESVIKSAMQMTRMCKWGVPVAKILSPLRKGFRVILKNNQWGTYQEGLFRSGATSYNVLFGAKS